MKRALLILVAMLGLVSTGVCARASGYQAGVVSSSSHFPNPFAPFGESQHARVLPPAPNPQRDGAGFLPIRSVFLWIGAGVCLGLLQLKIRRRLARRQSKQAAALAAAIRRGLQRVEQESEPDSIDSYPRFVSRRPAERDVQADTYTPLLAGAARQ